MKNRHTPRWLLAAALGISAPLPLAALAHAPLPAAASGQAQQEEQTMYLDENFVPSDQRRAAYGWSFPTRPACWPLKRMPRTWT